MLGGSPGAHIPRYHYRSNDARRHEHGAGGRRETSGGCPRHRCGRATTSECRYLTRTSASGCWLWAGVFHWCPTHGATEGSWGHYSHFRAENTDAQQGLITWVLQGRPEPWGLSGSESYSTLASQATGLYCQLQHPRASQRWRVLGRRSIITESIAGSGEEELRLKKKKKWQRQDVL